MFQSLRVLAADGDTDTTLVARTLRQSKVVICGPLYAMGFTDQNAVIDIGWKLRCSKCGHKGATTQPDWTARKDVSGAPRHYS